MFLFLDDRTTLPIHPRSWHRAPRDEVAVAVSREYLDIHLSQRGGGSFTSQELKKGLNALWHRLPIDLLPYLWRAVGLHVGLPHTLDLRPQALIKYRTGIAPRRIAKLRSMAPVARRGSPQDLADRLAPKGVALLINESLQSLRRRSSSARAKNALASVRISLARRNPFTARSSALRRSHSAVVTPLRSPLATSSR